MPLINGRGPTLRGVAHAASRKPLVIPAHGGRWLGPYGLAITGREAGRVNAAESREGGGVPIRLVDGAATAARRI